MNTLKQTQIISAFALVVFFAASVATAEVKITFPDEELATESALPVFEDKVAVRNRKVNHKGKFEINLMGGLVASEPLYDPLSYGLSLAYHFDNTRAIHFVGAVFQEGLSGSGQSLRDGNVIGDNGSTSGQIFDPSKAPFKEFMVAAHYQYTAYYGKISLTRDKIMNLSLSGLIGGGVYGLTGLIAPAVNLGLSQRLYFTSNIALRMDILFSLYNGVDITSAGQLLPTAPAPDVDDFDRTMQFDTNVYMGLSILL